MKTQLNLSSVAVNALNAPKAISSSASSSSAIASKISSSKTSAPKTTSSKTIKSKIVKSVLVTASALGLAACSTHLEANHSEEHNLSLQDKAVALVSSIETGDHAAISYVNPEKYIQHNLAVGDGLEGFGAVMQQLPKGSAKAQVKRSFQDGNYVVTHTEYDFFGPKAGFDIFRFEDGLIVEHWDNLQAISPANASGRTQLDGTVLVTDLDKTEENKAIVSGFVSDILINGDMSKINHYIDNEDSAYLQHNPGVADGLSGLGEALGALAKAGMPMVFEKNHIILGQGNFVLSVSEGHFMNQHVAFYDLFRVEAGRIVEHWDTIEAIPARSDWKNDNGKFGF